MSGRVRSLLSVAVAIGALTGGCAIGPDYDQVNIGLAATQTQFGYTFQATGCDDLNSGNSNCGHEYGTTLSQSDKAALLEYLKTL